MVIYMKCFADILYAILAKMSLFAKNGTHLSKVKYFFSKMASCWSLMKVGTKHFFRAFDHNPSRQSKERNNCVSELPLWYEENAFER